MGVVNIRDYRWMNEDTKNIVDAIKESGEITAKKFDGMQESIFELAKSVHELATTNKFLSDDVKEIKINLNTLDKRINSIEPAAQNMKLITTIVLKSIIPLVIAGLLFVVVFYVDLK
jgi:chromosome segregation ATPase